MHNATNKYLTVMKQIWRHYHNKSKRLNLEIPQSRKDNALCIKIEKGAAFKVLEQDQSFHSHSNQQCRIIDDRRGHFL
jgi:hypothetical protein